MVYLLQRKGTNEYKVGISKHPEKRLRQLQVGNAEKLILIETWQGGRELEKKIHDKFRVDIKDKSRKLKGEWFWISPEWIRVLIFEINTRMV